MMQMLDLPHRVVDYLCPVNGLCDIFEWKSGERIPEELVFYSRLGFQLISQKRVDPPKMIFLSNSGIGRRQFEFWQGLMNYHIYSSEGKTFKTTLSEIRELVDKGIPVILFGLDMFHLPYHEKFYHTLHIPGHVILMTGYDEHAVYIQDNSKAGIRKVPFEDLMQAWAKDYIGISKRNAYFGIEFTEDDRDVKKIVQTAYQIAAEDFISPKTGFAGVRGIDKFIKEFPEWKERYDTATLHHIYMHFVTFTGSTLPGPPAEITGGPSEVYNPHKGCRDKLSQALNTYRKQYGSENWTKAAALFEESGTVIEEISNGFVTDILANSCNNTDHYMDLFHRFKQLELAAFEHLIV